MMEKRKEVKVMDTRESVREAIEVMDETFRMGGGVAFDVSELELDRQEAIRDELAEVFERKRKEYYGMQEDFIRKRDREKMDWLSDYAMSQPARDWFTVSSEKADAILREYGIQRDFILRREPSRKGEDE